jgi:Rap1a immunity proteins
MQRCRTDGVDRPIATLAAASLALLAAAGAPGTARGQAPSPPVGVTTGTLAEMCAAGGGTDVISGAAVGYCRGFLIATGQYHAELTAGRSARPPVFCLPDPSPTVEAAQDSFVAWARANPQSAGEKALIGVMRWAAATYPCPTRPAARAPGGDRR